MGASLPRTRRMRWLAVTSVVLGLLLIPGAAIAIQPIIETVAGGGQFDGQQATAVNVQPYGVTTDRNGEIYLSDQSSHRVFRIDPQSGIITTVAGNGLRGTAGDGGPATAAGLAFPAGLAIDSAGNLYIADSGNHRVRLVTPSGIISTLAGASSPGLSGDGGPADQAQLNSPQDVAVDADGNVFIADSGNNRIRRVSAATHVISTVAGTTQGFAGDGGPATAAKLGLPFGIGFDSAGRLLIADSLNNRIRLVDIASGGTISTIAGTGSSTFNGDGLAPLSTSFAFPMDVGVDSQGNVLVLDSNHSRLRRLIGQSSVETVAGGSLPGFSGDGGSPSQSLINSPSTIATDPSGTIYIADTGNRRLRRISADGLQISTVAGTGLISGGGDGLVATAAVLSKPVYSLPDGLGGFYLIEQGSSSIRHVGADGVLSTIAGTGSFGFGGDNGPAGEATLSSPSGVCRDGAGNLYVADSSNNRVRKIPADTQGRVTPQSIITTVAGGGTALGDGGPATQARLSFPTATAVDTFGNLYIADASNNRIRRVDRNGTITTVVGTGVWGYAGDGGSGTAARIALPWDLALDTDGHLYIADLQNNRVRRYDTNSGVITTAAGDGTAGFSGDGGPAALAELAAPNGVAVDADGNLYIADSGNIRVRRVDAQTGLIETIAGTGYRTAWLDGFGGDPADDLNDGQSPLMATFLNPAAVSVDGVANSLLITDPELARVRRIQPLSQPASTPTSTPTKLQATATPTGLPTFTPSPTPTKTLPPAATATPTIPTSGGSTGVDLALGRPASQSSTVYGGAASRAVDGNTIGTFSGGSVTHTNQDTQAWWQVDLGSVQPIASIDIWNRTDCCATRLSQYYVLVSDTPFTSTNLNTALSQTGVTGIFLATPAGRPTTIGINRTGRYIRVQLSGQDYLSLAEVQVWQAGTSAPSATATATATVTVPSGGGLPTNVALGRPASQSSTAYGGSPNRAVDGITNGNFSLGSVTHTGNDPNGWWQVDLGAITSISNIAVWNRTDCCSDRLSQFYVLVSDNPFTSTNLSTTLAQSGVASYFVAGAAGTPSSLTINRTGRYVRVQLSGQNNLSLAEVQVWSSASGTTPAPTWTATALPTATPQGGGGGSNGNLAFGRPAIQSSTAFGADASRAVDGNVEGTFSLGSVSHTDQDTEAWWQVDLGSIASITTINIWNRTDCCGDRLSQFYVLVSDAPFASTSLAATLTQSGVSSYFVSATTGNPTSLSVNRTGRYVRVQLSGTGYLSLAEVQVWDGTSTAPPSLPSATPTATPATGGSIDLALGKSAVQSSTAFGSDAARAADGNVDGNWSDNSVSHTSWDSEAWWQVDLGAQQAIGRIEIWNRTDCCSSRLQSFYVLVSQSPFSSTGLGASLSQPGVSSVFVPGPVESEVTVNLNTTGRYVKIQLSGQDYLSLAEVRVFSP